MSLLDPCLIRSRGPAGQVVVRLGMPLVDDYLEFLEGRCRPNTVLAAAYDLRLFFAVVDKPAVDVRPADVLGFITAQRHGRSQASGVQVVEEEASGVATSTVARRLSIISGFFAYLQARGDIDANPVPRGLPSRRERLRPAQGVPLTRRTRRLPRILTPDEVDALTAALRTDRDRAMVAAMIFGGLRRCEVLGLRLEDLRVAERRVFIADGKGGHQRLIPVSSRFFTAVAVYLDTGLSRDGIASTIVDATSLVARGEDSPKPVVRILREGAITREQLEDVLGDLLEPAEQPGDVDPDVASDGTA